MGRIIAIDYGTKRIGLAVTDTMQIIANGLCTVPYNEAIEYLRAYISKENVDLFVVGLPKQLNNEPSENMRHINDFVNRLQKLIPDIPVEFSDERFTSTMAHRAMIDGGLSKKRRQDKALVDKISATLILQGFLEKKRFTSQ